MIGNEAPEASVEALYAADGDPHQKDTRVGASAFNVIHASLMELLVEGDSS